MSDEELQRIAQVIDEGGVVGIPTDTVYGLACHPDRPDAAERIYAIKQRPPGMELSLLGATLEDVAAFGTLEGPARALAERYWPGGLSLIVEASTPRHPAIPRQGSTISLRVPHHALLRELLARTGPLASTSANRHGRPAATTADEVRQQLGDQLDAVLDGGPAAGRASTIIDCSAIPPRVLRAGPIGHEELRPYLEG